MHVFLVVDVREGSIIVMSLVRSDGILGREATLTLRQLFKIIIQMLSAILRPLGLHSLVQNCLVTYLHTYSVSIILSQLHFGAPSP